MRHARNLHAAASALFVTLLASCGSTPNSTFYLMDVAPGSGQVAADERELAVAVGPIHVADYLDRPQIVTRADGNRVDIREYDRWAEPLKTALPRMMALHLTRELSTRRVVLHPSQDREPLDYRVSADIARFEGQPGGEVTLQARWTLTDEKTKEIVAVRLSEFTESAASGDVDAIIAAMNVTYSSLCGEIAAAIRQLDAGSD